ncbi:hypothetical protein llap_8 [Limosa lapponica baueri]|uniref:Rna-directed dna polymerase from mobile element jockey-like n=1 Tax=Limosa lapponica baueri TaxID=1758121 RepID=A0A2I0UU99_LIMLA|nr:hypothetical protein llap_8 [Limosa lapponica baueri]
MGHWPRCEVTVGGFQFPLPALFPPVNLACCSRFRIFTKKEKKEDAGNYRPVSLALIPVKMMEQILLGILGKCMEDKRVIGSREHGFTKGRSCLTIPVAFYSELTGLVDEQSATPKEDSGDDLALLGQDFHGKLGPLACFPALLAGGAKPEAALANPPCKSPSFSEEAVQGPTYIQTFGDEESQDLLPFYTVVTIKPYWFIDVLSLDISSVLRYNAVIQFTTLSTRQLLPLQGYVLFAFIMKRSYAQPNVGLGEAKIISAQHMIEVIARENDALLMTMAHEKYSRNITTVHPSCISVNILGTVCKNYFFNKGKCQVLHLWRNNPMHQYTLGTDQLESSFAEKDLGVLVDSMTHQHALETKKVNGTLGWIRKRIASWLRDMIRPLCSVLVRPHLECCVQYKRDMGILD